MKKVLVLAFIVTLMLTGCGAGATNTLSCSYENNIGNITSRMTYNIDYEGTEVKKLRVTYKYNQMDNNSDNANEEVTDGVGTGTDGTTNDTQIDNDGIIDGVVGSAIDSVINGITDVILDISGLRDRHTTVKNTYGNINGFSSQNIDDTDNNYTVTYIIDYDTISDEDLATLNLSRNIDILRSNYTSQGFTCK